MVMKCCPCEMMLKMKLDVFSPVHPECWNAKNIFKAELSG